MDRTTAVKEFEKIALVWLLPLDAVGGEGPEVEAFDVRAGHEFVGPG